MIKRVYLLICILFLSVSAQAAITLSEPQNVYNLGDKLYVSASGITGLESGSFNIDLVCGGNTTNLVKIPARSFSAEKEQTYSIPYKILEATDLEIVNISNLLGSCEVKASLGSSTASTKSFEISNELSVSGALDKEIYRPGEPITLIVKAQKANGQPFQGFIAGENATSFTKTIDGGKLIETFLMPATSEAKGYHLVLRAYDESNGGIANQGTTQVFFQISQVPSSLILGLSDTTAVPGKDFKINSEVFDQAGKKIEGTIELRIISPLEEERGFQLNSGNSIDIDFPSNATPGIWRAASYFNELAEVVEFEIAEIKKVDFLLEGSVLLIKNVGNTIYDKQITVNIGEEEEILTLNIEVGEERTFNFKAPDGDYELTVTDGESSISQTAFLTGRAISVKELGTGSAFNYATLLILLVILLGAGGIAVLYKIKKSKRVGASNEPKKHKKSSKKMSLPKIKNPFKKKSANQKSFLEENSKSKSITDIKENKPSQAESSVVLSGEKYSSAVISVHVKNFEGLKNNAKAELKRIIKESHGGKGLEDWKADHVFIVFSPLVTKTYRNELIAAKSGFRMVQELKKHNKKFSDKINFNLGIHSGELIASKVEGKLKYTSIGNTISFARRLSDSGEEKLLISEEVQKKMLRNLKVSEETPIGEKKVYSIVSLKNQESDQLKLQELLKRMDE